MRKANKLEMFKWCPSCSNEEVIEQEAPKIAYIGTEGFGQPIRFSDCHCGNVYGWLDVGFYRDKKVNIDDNFKSYLKKRIEHYFKG